MQASVAKFRGFPGRLGKSIMMETSGRSPMHTLAQLSGAFCISPAGHPMELIIIES